MSGHLLFWILAFLIALTAIVVAAVGVYKAARGHIEAHRRLMDWSVALVFVFVAAYLAKVLNMGREDLSVWSAGSVIVLRIHESLVAMMLASGVYARILARKTIDLKLAQPFKKRHRLAGRMCITSAILVLFTGFFVLKGLIERAG